MNDEARTGAGWCERLYDERAASLLLYGRALGLGHLEAEDVLQDTFLALLKLAQPPGNPAHYLVRAFRNRALNYRRNLWRRLAREFESRRWFDPGAATTEAEEAAMRSLPGLPADQREVIVLKIWHDLTFENIGELLGISPNTAAGRFRYGLRKLKACLEGKGYARIESEPLEPARGATALLDAAPTAAEG
jgi:RNA polymerase sigma-70 factor (ECF subfamily)